MFVCSECGLPQPGDGRCSVDGTPLVPIGEDVLLGTMIGVYRVATLLGIGGMGRVYKGVHPTIGSRVAIKVLSRECTDRRDLVDRFFAEAKAVNLIRHESIVNVLDLAMLPDGRPYIIMEYLDGAPLQAIVDHSVQTNHPLPLGGLARLTVEVLDALHAAHGKGIIHRDLKPDNIYVAPSGRPKVLDFGIAKLSEPGSGGATRTGSLLGTPHYMSPEQAAGRPVDHRSDIYAIGVILFETMTGRKPFVAESLFELLRQHVEAPPPSPRLYRAEIDANLEGVILCALAKLPDQRFSTAQAMSMALQNATAHLPAEQWTPITGSGTHRAQPTGWQHTPPQSWGSKEVPVRQLAMQADQAPRGVPRPSEQPLDQYLAQHGLQHQTTVSASSGQVQKQQPAKKSKRGLWLALAAIAILIGVGATIAVVAGGERDTVAANEPAPPPVDKPGDKPETKPGDKPDKVEPKPAEPDKPVKVADVDEPKPGKDKAKPKPKAESDDDDDIDKQIRAVTKDLPADVRKQVNDALDTDGKPAKPGAPAPLPAPKKGAWVQDRALQMAGWNPNKVDVNAFVRFAVAEARKAAPDALLTRIDVTGVDPDGWANLSLPTLASEHGDIDIRFISPAASKPGPDEVQGVPHQRLCEFRVMGSPEGIEITPMFKTDCKTKAVAVPSCTMKALWGLARAQGAPAGGGKVVANIDYYQASMHDSPRWFFDVGFGHDVSFSKMWSASSCP